MGKKEAYAQNIGQLLDEYLKSGRDDRLRDYLTRHSNLPGPRANLELADAFATSIERYAETHPREAWELCIGVAGIPERDAPSNDPREFMVLCAVIGFGGIGSSAKTFSARALSKLRACARDKRWRVREGVAMGLQRMIASEKRTMKEIEGWISDSDWLVLRAVAAGVAEPRLLKEKDSAKVALKMHAKILAKVVHATDRKSEEFKVLRQALGYSLSVVTHASPEEGFELMGKLADERDGDVLWVLRENLKKDRLVNNFPSQVASLSRLLKKEA